MRREGDPVALLQQEMEISREARRKLAKKYKSIIKKSVFELRAQNILEADDYTNKVGLRKEAVGGARYEALEDIL